jgi:transposase
MIRPLFGRRGYEVNVLKPHLQSTVFTLIRKGLSQREIHRKTGIDRKTIRGYANAMVAAAIAAEANSSTLATGSGELPDFQIPPPRPPAIAAEIAPPVIPKLARSACEPYREWIEAQVRLRRNAVAIYQELVDQHGFTQRYNSVKRFCRGLRRCEPEQFDRLEFGPAEESQVDYGEGAPTRHPVTGKYRKPRLFVMTLRYSRRSFRQVVWKSSSETWARLHEQAFRYFGGSTHYCVLDNLKEGVITPDIYEPTINRLYAAVLAHHHCVADPARVRDPDRKGTVENAIQHTQSTALKGKKFESIEAQNQHLMDWEERWAATRIHGRAKRQVEAMFQEEKPFLTALPLEPFRYFKEETRTVQDDRTVQVDDSWYAARPARIGSQVIVRIFERDLEIRDIATLELIRCHTLAYKKGEVLLPEEERIFNPSRQTRQILRQAEKIGPNAQALCQRLFDKRGREAQKSMWGIVALVPRFPVSIVEQAATAAIARHLSSSKAVRAIAEQLLAQAIARLDAESPPPLTQQHELIREPSEYAGFFEQNAHRQLLPHQGD